MQINYTGAAFASLCDVVNYVESMNTFGAGVRWLNRFEMFLQQGFLNPTVIKLCNNQTFYSLQLRCLNFNDWVSRFPSKPMTKYLLRLFCTHPGWLTKLK